MSEEVKGMEETAVQKQTVKLRKSDLVKHWLLGYSSETCYNYERLQALGTANAMVPIVRRLYKTKEEQAKALKKYMVFFNTEPSYIGTVIHGVAASMEEQAANGEDISAEEINSVRTGLMGPMAGIGDTVSQGIVYPILAGLACSLALAGNIMGPVIFEIAYKLIMLTMGYSMYMMGYKQGKSAILKFLKAGTLNKITDVFSIIGLMVVGNMAASRVNIVTPIAFNVGQVAVNIQSVLDSLLPGLLPLVATLLVWKLVSKKVKPTYIILILFAVGIVTSLIGALAVSGS
ncbi:PTS system mannose/fructose/sorbose family transporter subunit IID [Clostridium sp. KNHs216]|jgi:Phosphotransferase system, mannose/fructose/N-acetylgalactosamine-specific component IID|uniref:PTS system mannose/fructose/sorbose family transporter subunit IID n=1 Tax=Eubacteriales TaxID=186802 RepID=UPI0005710328|nr:PTS system mannose/fructose/sorbose family transporter subunit IID [Clostridium sp. KNHs216]TQI68256.1 PTS system mannose-specific IID component [Clostridium sp. KNHs216]